MTDDLAHLDVITERKDGLARVTLAGELDHGTAATLVAALEAVCTDDERVVLDLRRLEFMDSSGLAVILRWSRLAKDAAWDLVVVRGPEPVDRVFRMTRTDTLLELLDVPPV